MLTHFLENYIATITKSIPPSKKMISIKFFHKVSKGEKVKHGGVKQVSCNAGNWNMVWWRIASHTAAFMQWIAPQTYNCMGIAQLRTLHGDLLHSNSCYTSTALGWCHVNEFYKQRCSKFLRGKHFPFILYSTGFFYKVLIVSFAWYFFLYECWSTMPFQVIVTDHLFWTIPT